MSAERPAFPTEQDLRDAADLLSDANANNYADQIRTHAATLARAEQYREALAGLVAAHEHWNAGVMKVIGRPVNWTDDYLDKARALLVPDGDGR